jgi:hypothetical protein
MFISSDDLSRMIHAPGRPAQRNRALSGETLVDVCRSGGESAYRDHPGQVLHIDPSAECTDDLLDRPVFPQEGQAGLADAKQGGAIGSMGH